MTTDATPRPEDIILNACAELVRLAPTAFTKDGEAAFVLRDPVVVQALRIRDARDTLRAQLAESQARVKRLEEAATRRVERGHSVACAIVLHDKRRRTLPACTCGHDELGAALAAKEGT